MERIMNFEIEKAISQGINVAKDNFLVIWVNGLIAGITMFLAFITIIGSLVVPAIAAGYFESLLRVRRGEKVEIGDFFTFGFNHFGPFLGLAILLMLGIFFGFLFLIIPGIFLTIAWYFAYYVKIDNPDITVTEALSMSMSLVSKIGWWKLFALIIIVGLASMVLNFFTFQLASLVIYPFTYMITVEAYILATDSGEPVNVKSDDIKMINETTSDDVNEETKIDEEQVESSDSINEETEETEEIKKLKEKQAKELEELKEIERLKEKQAKELEDLKNEHSKKADD